MSSNGGNRKSMDDVLSSIRRIIGAEKKDGYDELPEPGGQGAEAPLNLGAPIAAGDPAKAAGGAAAAEGDPLSLTPNMRVDFSKLGDRGDDADATRIGGPAPQPQPMPLSPEQLGGSREPDPVAPLAAVPDPEPSAPSYPAGDEDDEAVLIDEAALEEMIRRIVREELDAQRAAEADRQEEMRQVVRDELMGETGQNISRNVQRMIQAEVSRMLSES